MSGDVVAAGLNVPNARGNISIKYQALYSMSQEYSILHTLQSHTYSHHDPGPKLLGLRF